MLTAKEACDLSKSNKEAAINKELRDLENLILRATSRGDFHAYLYDKISNNAKTILENNGYNVDIQYTQRDGYSVYISWKNGCN